MKIFLTSVNTFEYGDSNWRVAIKLIYRNMVQESRHDDHYTISDEKDNVYKLDFDHVDPGRSIWCAS